jgi:DNA-binding MarR family transcriptional regulator
MGKRRGLFQSAIRPMLALAEKCAYAPISVHMPLIPARLSPGDRSSSAPSPACACGRLRRTTRTLTQLYDDAMAPAGLRVTQFSLLRTLAAVGRVRISNLAARQLLDRTALSRNLDPLVEQGLVDIVCGDDARTREAAITRKGRSTLRAATPYWARAQKEVAVRLGRDKLDALIAVLGELESLHPSKRPSPRNAGRGSPPARRASRS